MREFSDSRTLHLIMQLSSTTRAGLPILRTLKLLQGNAGPTATRYVWRDVEQAIHAGSTFGEALQRQSPPIPAMCVEMITAGEESGHLDLVLAQLRRYYEMRAGLRRAVVGATAYPLFVAFFGFCIWTFLAVLGADNKLAAAGTMLFGLLTVVCLVGGTVLLITRTTPGRLFLHASVLQVPVVGGALRKLALARFARTLAMMYTSGMRMEVALDRACQAAGNVLIVADLRKGARRVANGDRLAEAFGACKYIPATMREMLETGEVTGTHDETMAHIAEIYENDARLVLFNLPKLIGPVMLIAIGGLVVYLYYTYYMRPYVIDPMNELFPQ